MLELLKQKLDYKKKKKKKKKNQVNNTTWTYFLRSAHLFKYSQPRDDLEFREEDF